MFLELPRTSNLKLLKPQLPPKQQRILDHQSRLKTTKAIRVDKIDITKLKIDRTIDLNLFPNKSFRFKVRKVDQRSKDDFTWFGTISIRSETGTAVLVVKEDNVTGNIRVGKELFSVRPLGSGLHMIIQVDQSQFPPDHPPGFDRPAKMRIDSQVTAGLTITRRDSEVAASITTEGNQIVSQNTPGLEGAPEGDDKFGYAVASGDFNGDGYADLAIGVPYEDIKSNTEDDGGAVNVLYGSPIAAKDTKDTIRVMVAFTPAASQGSTLMGTPIGTQIQQAVDETNDSYDHSEINQRIELAHTVEVDYVESGSHDTDLDRLKRTNDGHMDNIHALRDEHAADVVVLLIDDNDGCGLAYIYANANEAFAVVHYDNTCATGNYSFGHEIGHLQGARHDPYVDDRNNPFAYGHGYVNFGNRWRTIMAYNDECDCSNEVSPCPILGARNTPRAPICNRLQYWSNPNVDHPTGNVPMGDAQCCNNARVLNKTAHRTANFRLNLVMSDQIFSQYGVVEGEAESGDRFGYALAAGDFNGDGYADLAIGVPYEDIKDNSENDGGAVNVLFGK